MPHIILKEFSPILCGSGALFARGRALSHADPTSDSLNEDELERYGYPGVRVVQDVQLNLLSELTQQSEG